MAGICWGKRKSWAVMLGTTESKCEQSLGDRSWHRTTEAGLLESSEEVLAWDASAAKCTHSSRAFLLF